MAETRLAARPAFGASLPTGRLGALSGAAGVFAREQVVEAAVCVLGGPGGSAPLADAIRGAGIELPEPRRWTRSEEFTTLWLGPERWLVMGPGNTLGALHEAVGGDGALVDQSDARAVLRLSGPLVREALSRMLPIDLHPRAHGPGDVSVTQGGHIGFVLWQVDDAATYDIAVARSFADSFARWLIESTAEFGLLVEG